MTDEQIENLVNLVLTGGRLYLIFAVIVAVLAVGFILYVWKGLVDAGRDFERKR